MTSIKGTLVAHSTRISMTLAAELAATLVATAAPAEAGDRGPAGAQTAARAAVTPETAEAVHCFRATEQRGASQRRRVFCLVAHVAPVGQICRSLVEVSTPTRGYGATARVIRRNVCMPFTDVQP